ncbi:hypothetical protein R6Q59_034770 [Mikania micrantha]
MNEWNGRENVMDDGKKWIIIIPLSCLVTSGRGLGHGSGHVTGHGLVQGSGNCLSQGSGNCLSYGSGHDSGHGSSHGSGHGSTHGLDHGSTHGLDHGSTHGSGGSGKSSYSYFAYMFASSQQKDKAKDSWKLLRKEKGAQDMKGMNWTQFKELFLKHFCPHDRITEEFLQLRQKEENINTIIAIFYDKARFFPNLLQAKRMWINRYHTMLNTKYREFLTPSKCDTLMELIDCARERELEL